ncbi:MAG: aldo/keto reductase [Defluviitaleaceae bacterium]|nr:aldo/keto reductase [Defluviitaleaceae bacterium]
MKRIKIGGVLEASAIAMGCMRIADLSTQELITLIKTGMDGGIDLFDHADIYGGGQCEIAFGKAVREAGIPRDKLVVQTKCGIRKGQFDFSKDYIVESLDNSLKRLGMDYVDMFMLHRPDTLVEYEEVAEAFTILQKAGKAKYYGVSNHGPGQIRLLNKYLSNEQRIIANQLQFSPAHTGMIDAGLNVNMTNPPAYDRDGGILDFCRLEDITIQTWSPFMYGYFEGVFLGSDKYPELNQTLNELAAEKNVPVGAVVIAWILRHPANMQAVSGTTELDLLKSTLQACSFEIGREEWYRIYLAAGNKLP